MANYNKKHFAEFLLDTHNPRLPKSMGGESESEIINYLLSDSSLIELMLAIGKNGFFEGEQLLVVPDKDKFTVIEGNRRLAAVKLLHNPNIAKIYKSKIEQVIKESDYFPEEIPCLEFENKDEILKYLGYRHITGIKSWKLLEKARYITKLKKGFYKEMNLQVASREIAKMIGSRKDYVRRILVGFKLYEAIENNGFYKIKDLNDTNFHFNYIADSLSRSNIVQYIGVDLEKDNPLENINFECLEKWTNWLFNKDLPNKIIGDSEHLNALNKVLNLDYPDAKEAFISGEKLFKALEYTDDINQQFQNAINEALSQLERADSITHKVNGFYSGLLNDLQSIYRISKKIRTIKEELESEKFDDEF